MKTLFIFVIFFSAHLVYAHPEIVPMQEKALGQSMTGAHLLNDSIFSNPAASSFLDAYALDASYFPPKTMAVSVLDTRTSAVSAGFGYFRKGTVGVQDPLQGVKLNFSGRAQEQIGIGFGTKILWGPNKKGEHKNLKDLDAGVLFNLGQVQLGMAVRNLMGGDKTLEQHREWAVGGRYGYNESLLISAAFMSHWGTINPYQFGFGLELITPYSVSLKGGYRTLPLDRLSYWSIGTSVISQKLSLHYALETPNQGKAEVEHALGMTVKL